MKMKMRMGMKRMVMMMRMKVKINYNNNKFNSNKIMKIIIFIMDQIIQSKVMQNLIIQTTQQQ